MLVVGGSGSLLGAVVGALAVSGLDSFLAAAENGVDLLGWHIDLPAGTRVIVVGVADGARPDRAAVGAHRRARARAPGGAARRTGPPRSRRREGLRRGRRLDRQPVRGAPRPGRRRLGPHPARGACGGSARARASRVSGRADFTAQVEATADPAALPDAELVLLACKGTDLEPLAALLEGRLAGATVMTVQNGLGAEEIVAAPRRLAAPLLRHVHERDAPRRRARRVRARHGDLDRPVPRHDLRGRARGSRR